MELENDTVQKTLCMPLWAREISARKCPQVLPDHDAARILAELDAGKPTLMYRLQYFYTNVAIRHYNYAVEIGEYLAGHPDATIVEMGAGLSCQRRQMASAGLPGATNPWYAVDFPNVIELRKAHVPADGIERHIASDLMDFSWMDQIDFDPARGIFFTGCGLFYYFSYADGRALVSELARRFPGGALAFDIASPTGSKGVNAEVKASNIDVCIDSAKAFALKDPVAEVSAFCPEVAGVTERDFFDGYLDQSIYRRTPLTRICQWVLQHFRLGFFVHVDFAEG